MDSGHRTNFGTEKSERKIIPSQPETAKILSFFDQSKIRAGTFLHLRSPSADQARLLSPVLKTTSGSEFRKFRT
jgi:hypothetical protein